MGEINGELPQRWVRCANSGGPSRKASTWDVVWFVLGMLVVYFVFKNYETKKAERVVQAAQEPSLNLNA